ncbi:MAG: hypothetical protein U5R31_05625 [Acidimicrobiia bacterium]|nr:hypothetical protein [Acidimicrobiia bacterium]
MAHSALVDTIGEVAPDLEVRGGDDEVEIGSATATAVRPTIVRTSVTPAVAGRLVSGPIGPAMVVADLIQSAARRFFGPLPGHIGIGGVDFASGCPRSVFV